MFVGRITKENEDVSRFTVDLSEWLDEGETVTDILSHSIILGTTGWSNTPFPVPGSNPPYDPTPLLYTLMNLVDGGTAVEVYVSFGTPGNVYTCQMEVIGSTLREVNFEVGVQISGQPPAAPPIVVQPIPPDALSIMGGTMLGPLYLYEDPVYPTEASTKQYVDWTTSQLGVDTKVARSGDTMTGYLQLFADPSQPLQAATKAYVDMQTGSALTDAPADGSTYGRQNFAWVKAIEEAPANVFGYLRLNGAWSKGVPESAALDLRYTDQGGAYGNLSAWQTPPSAGADVLQLSARRTSGGAADDGGVLQLFGPSFTGNANVVALIAGPRATAKVWRFDPDGTLSTPGHIFALGRVQSSAGRLISIGANSLPSITAWDTALGVASGFWVGTGGTIGFGSADGGGVPITAWATLSSTGLTVPSLGSGAINSSGNIAAVGNLYARGGSVFFGPGDTGVLTSDGSSAILRFRSDNWNLAWNGSNGTLSFNKPGAALFTVDAGGSGSFLGNLNVGAALTAASTINAGGTISAPTIYSSGLLQAANGGMSLGTGGSGRYMQFAPSWYWDWNASNGDLNWITASGQMAIFRQADKILFATQGPCAGIGVYQNLSDMRTKTDVQPVPYGLPEVLRINPILFHRVDSGGRLEIGFSAQELRGIIPEAVMPIGYVLPDGTGGLDDPDPTLAMGIDGVVAALVNANKELAARVTALEAR